MPSVKLEDELRCLVTRKNVFFVSKTKFRVLPYLPILAMLNISLVTANSVMKFPVTIFKFRRSSLRRFSCLAPGRTAIELCNRL